VLAILIEYSVLVAGSFAKSDRELLASSGAAADQFVGLRQWITTIPEVQAGIFPRVTKSGRAFF
jgi:hypothetical protein